MNWATSIVREIPCWMPFHLRWQIVADRPRDESSSTSDCVTSVGRKERNNAPTATAPFIVPAGVRRRIGTTLTDPYANF